MLCEQKDRFSAEKVLRHPWVDKLAPNYEHCHLEINIDTLKSYINSTKFKKAALTFIATRLKEDEIKILKETFISIDKNFDGFLSYEEFKIGCEKCEKLYNDKNFEIFFSAFFDYDRNAKINYTQFIAGTIDKHIYLKEERLYEAFLKFDIDKSGKISKNEIEKALIYAEINDINCIKEEIIKFDTNKDGEMDYVEFCNMMSKY